MTLQPFAERLDQVLAGMPFIAQLDAVVFQFDFHYPEDRDADLEALLRAFPTLRGMGLLRGEFQSTMSPCVLLAHRRGTRRQCSFIQLRLHPARVRVLSSLLGGHCSEPCQVPLPPPNSNAIVPTHGI